MYNNWYILITPESQYSYRKKNYQRPHNVCFPDRPDAFPWTSLLSESYPGFMSGFQHTMAAWGRCDYPDSGGRNIFLRATLWSKILTVILSVVVSSMNKWGLWGSLYYGAIMAWEEKWQYVVIEMSTQVLWHQVQLHTQEAVLRGTRVSKPSYVLECPKMRMVRVVVVQWIFKKKDHSGKLTIELAYCR